MNKKQTNHKANPRDTEVKVLELTKKDYETIDAIVDRAEKEGVRIYVNRHLTFFMDFELAAQKLNLDLERLLNASRSDFFHDIIGIAKDVDRQNKKFSNLFVPRCSK